MTFFLVVILAIIVVAIVLVLVSRPRAADVALAEQIESAPSGEADPATRAEDEAQMLEADNRHRREAGEPEISVEPPGR